MIMTCLTTMIINISNLAINEQDLKALKRSTVVCAEKKGCLDRFEKREEGLYRAYCGAKVSFDPEFHEKAELQMLLDEMDRLGDSEERKKQKLRNLGYKVK